MEILVEGLLDYYEERSWKKRYFVMKYEISSALRYIEIYKDKNWHKQLPRHVVNLHPGYEVNIKMEPKKKHCFFVKTTDHTLLLANDDENVVTLWMNTLEEYNLVKSFCVQPHDTPTMVRIDAILPCHLQLVHSEVRLVSAMDGKLLGLWPFKCIRRYKFVGNLFSIEAGRKAPTGEGIFEFISNECSEIYRVMDTIIRTKAGNTTMKRFASEKIHNKIVEEHLPLRKINSVPISPKKETNHDYAEPVQNTLAQRPSSVSSNPLGHTYDLLSPTIRSPTSPNQPDVFAINEYNTLQFAGPSVTALPPRTSTISEANGRYDTLKFTDDASEDISQTLQRNKQYDSLMFDQNIEDDSNGGKHLKNRDSVYNTLDHSSGSASSTGGISDMSMSDISSNYYSLNPDLASNTYDAIENCATPAISKVSTGSPSKTTTLNHTWLPTQPTRPPPRMKAPGIPKQQSPRINRTPEVPQRKISRMNANVNNRPNFPTKKLPSGLKPLRAPPVPHQKAKEMPDERPKLKAECMSEMMRRKLHNTLPVVDDNNYASIDHEYSSIDYGQCSQSNTSNSSDIYTDPDENVVKPTIAAKPVRPKPKKQFLNKKAKDNSDGKTFAEEFRKKLDIKLRKTRNKPEISDVNPQPHSDADIYEEVDDSQRSYYSEPDTYSEPAV